MKMLNSIKEKVSYLLFSIRLKRKMLAFDEGAAWVNQQLAIGVPAEDIQLYLDLKTSPDAFDLGAYYQLSIKEGATNAPS